MTGQKPIELLNLDRIKEKVFRDAIRRYVREYVAHFGERLVAVYVSGSIHRNEAVTGVSDLDLMSFVRDPLRKEDGEWRERTRPILDEELGPLHGLTLPRTLTEAFLQALPDPPPFRYAIVPDPADGTLRYQPEASAEPLAAPANTRLPEWARSRLLTPDEARAWGLRLRYDATLLWGRDITQGIAIPPPDLSWAQIAFLSPWEIVRFAAAVTRENQTDFDLPDEVPLRLRYLAKLAVYGGASLLMARGQFRSYRGPDVLDPLAQVEPAWAAFLAETRGLYVHPVDAAVERLPSYLARCAEWMEWIGAELGYQGASP